MTAPSRPQIERDEHGRPIYRPDGDVLLAFLRDRVSRVKILRGPIGSGKSRAMCQEIWLRACEQARAHDGIRKSRWGVVRNCYDDETEILTETRGWVLFRDLVEGEKVAQLRDDNLEFVAPTYYYQAPYVGEMIGFEGEGVNFKVTPDHRMWVSSIYGRAKTWMPYEFHLASEIYGKPVRVKRDAEWVGDAAGRSVELFEWLGLWFAEGSCYQHLSGGSMRTHCLLTQTKPDGIAYARRLFNAIGVEFSENARSDGGINFRLLKRPGSQWLFDELLKAGKATAKRLPQWVKDAPAGHLRAFLKGYIAGDGHSRPNSTVAYTSSSGMADDLQEVALRAGMVANLAVRDRCGQAMTINGVATGTTAPEWTISFVEKREPILQGKGGRYRGWYRERYAGTVYCIEVPTHVVYVRRRGRAFWCSQTYPDLEGTTVKTWLETFPEEIYGRFNWSKPFTHHIRVGDVDLEVYFFALDKDEDVRKLRSLELTGIWFNEAQYIEKVLVDESDSRVGRYPPMSQGGPSWHGMILDMNEPSEDHWIPLMMGEVDFPEDMTLEERRAYRKPDGWKYYVQPPAFHEVFGPDGKTVVGYTINGDAENTRWLVPGYYRNLVQGKSKAWIDSRLMNRISIWVEGKPVWPMFRVETHVAKEVLRPAPGHDIAVGLDFGRRPAAIFGQCVNGRWLILAELIMHDVGATTFAPEVRRVLETKFPGCRYRLWGDPKGQDKTQSDERTAYDVFRSFGLQVQPAPVKQNNIQTRIEAVEFVLNGMRDGAPRFLLSPVCRALKVAMAGKYHFRKIKGTSGYAEEPEKDKYSNPCFVAGTMVSTVAGRVAIESLKAGDMVQTPIGARRIIATMSRKVDRLAEVILSDGRQILCTPNHLFAVNGGFSRADALQYNEVLYGEGDAWDGQRNIRSRNSTGSASIGRKTAITGPIRRSLAGAASSCSGMFGSTITGLFQKVLRFITTVATKQRTPLGTSFFSMDRLTLPFIGRSVRWLIRAGNWTDWNSRGWPRLNGIEATQAGNGTASTAFRSPRRWRLRGTTALGVAENMRSSAVAESAVSVPCPAKGWLERPLASMTKIEPVLSVARASEPTGMLQNEPAHRVARVRCYRPRSAVSVYDITVDETHVFYAEGVLVHNCDALQYLMIGGGEGRAMVGRDPVNTAKAVDTRPGGRRSLRRARG